MATPRSAPAHGWYTWFDGSDLNLLFWQRAADGRLVALEADRARLLADVIARLPEGESSDRTFELLDARGEVLHRFGLYEPAAGTAPLARLDLRQPLAAWQIVAHAPAQALGRMRVGLWSGLGLGLFASALALSGLAFYLYREHARGVRLAESRVSFVNRVSHELKTPLTNIRLYAELLEERLDDDDEVARRQLAVVIAEGQRLGRLIDNVLTFGRHQRGALRLRSAPGAVDAIVARASDRWAPALTAKGVRLVRRLAAPDAVMVDADALAQILDNLLSNVEKYAASGGEVVVTTEQGVRETTIVVADRGPGVPAEARERVFEPFERLHDNVTEAAAGTGIGLSIVRELARLHGGDVSVRAGDPGALFEVRIATPRVDGGAS
ncbi:MAG: HAMP domain-containing histidine kinase [Vicinamibacteria bacterium]|nr:HAMP domain-containing histidine kinase [Vicinamibacteria bacterium]